MKNKDVSAKEHLSRRRFIKSATIAAGAAIGVPALLPSSVFGANSPSERINLGCIGVGRMGRVDVRDIIGFDAIQIQAVCDVDSNRAIKAKKLVEDNYAMNKKDENYRGCSTYGDFRELISRTDIDAVMICTPDHWHVLPAVAAAKAGKDIFMEKPASLTIAQGRQLSDTVNRYSRVFQIGSQQRSDRRFRLACELVRNGRIGKLQTVRVGFGIDPSTAVQQPMPVPANLDYDMWLGPAPWAPYTEKRVHPQQGFGRPGWLRISDYSAGMMTGWGSHHIDTAHWGMGVECAGPLEIQGKGVFPQDGLWNVHSKFYIEYLYPGGVKMICADNKTNKQGVVFQGTQGWVYVKRGFIDAQPKSLLSSAIKPEELHLYKSDNHKKNFIDCIRTRRETVAPAEIAHRSCTACILGDIAMRLRRKLRWDPDNERFVDDPEADRMLSRPMRSPWTL